MSVHVCYLQRSRRGDAIAGLRLVGERTEESWLAPSPGRSDSPTADTVAAAVWLSQKLAASGSVLDVLCLDSDGSAAGWLTSPSPDPDVVAALARQGSITTAADGTSNATPLSEYAGTPDDASVAVLVLPQAGATRTSKKGGPAAPQSRFGVLAVNDVPARLLLDELDRRGITVNTTTTLWHAACQVLDPSAPANSPRTASGSPADLATPILTAILLIESSGRLVWAWSHAGSPIAAGVIRLAVHRQADEPHADTGRTGAWLARAGETSHTAAIHLGARDGSRLAAEWLAWSAQLGRTPARVNALIYAPPDANTDSLEAFGQALGTACPQTAIDLTTHVDPVSRILMRLAEQIDDAPKSHAAGATPIATLQTPLSALVARPTRAHRRLMVLASLAITAIAGAIGAAAYRLRVETGEAYTASLGAENAWRDDVKKIDAALLERPLEVPLKLQTLVNKLRKDATPKSARTESRPILAELSTLTMVLGDPEIHLAQLKLDTSSALIRIQGPLEQATAVEQALREIAGSHIAGWTSSTTRSGETLDAIFRGSWAASEPSEPAAKPPTKPPAGGGS